MLSSLMVFALIQQTVGLLGYDCGGSNLNVTTIALNSVGECNIPVNVATTVPIYMQLLQLSDFSHTSVIQCRIEIDRTIYYCGMHSHVSIVANGKQVYFQELDERACIHLQETGLLQLSNAAEIVGVRRNSTTNRAVTLAGSIKQDGTCAGTQYSDPFGTWENVVVQASVKIVVSNYQADANTVNNKILLRSGTHCVLSDGTCMDTEGNSAFWKTEPSDSCNFNHYDVLFEGTATKLINANLTTNNPNIYSLTTQETTFALAAKSEFHVCGYTLIRTEHPKLYILETTRGRTFASKTKISVSNLDIFSYVNSKFIYVEKHVRSQIQGLYQDVIVQRCKLERQVLQNSLTTATLFPEKFASTVTKSLGYTAVIAGEVAHIVKCTPVECSIRRTTECYNELPVTYRNSSRFLSPTSKILIKTGTQIECDPLLPAQYYIDNHWYGFNPNGAPVPNPQQLQPLSQPSWTYNPIGNLAESGIYTTEELNELRDKIMFPAEKSALLNTIARGSAGYSVPAGSIAFHNLLTTESIEQLAESTLNKMWHGLEKFGIISAGFFAVVFIFSTIKAVFDTIIQGYTLHTLYGWSFALAGAICNSLTHLLITRRYRNNNMQQDNIYHLPREQELTSVVASQPTPAPRGPTGVDPRLLERLTTGSQSATSN
ncbi:uncharacterized protein [Venturia canescens]|uniref:uncharacterized protein n=1 Tax=Venturia canescens TaxID=32260 RepID=UPI001C9BD492|nr:uncharacterized protein LOC122416415 [Venturia canescens]